MDNAGREVALGGRVQAIRHFAVLLSVVGHTLHTIPIPSPNRPLDGQMEKRGGSTGLDWKVADYFHDPSVW